jgi:hypothetical protein
LIDAPQLLVVRGNFPADNFADFLKYVKANPGKVNYASSGNGSLQHVTTELLKDLTKTFMVHIPYRGTGPALNDLLAGTVDFTITTPPPLLPHIRAGKLKALMVTGRTRLAAQPNVPTATEAGVPLVASSWFAVYGPTGLSADLQGRLSLAIRQVVESEELQEARRRARRQGRRDEWRRAGRTGRQRTQDVGADREAGQHQGRLSTSPRAFHCVLRSLPGWAGQAASPHQRKGAAYASQRLPGFAFGGDPWRCVDNTKEQTKKHRIATASPALSSVVWYFACGCAEERRARRIRAGVV